MRNYIILMFAVSFSFCQQNDKKSALEITKQDSIEKNNSLTIAQQHLINEFAYFVDSMKIYNDTSTLSVSNKLKIINAKYGQNTEVEIIQSLKRLNEKASEDAIEAIKSENDSFFVDNKFDFKKRKDRYFQLMHHVVVHQGDFNRFLLMEKKYNQLFRDSVTKKEVVESTIKGIKIYNEYVDSLDKQILPLDEKDFLKARALGEVCKTGLFEGEACYNIELMFKAYEILIKKYPNSKFANHADYLLFSESFCDEGGADSEELKERLKKYKIYLKKYQNADFEADIQFDIFYTLSAMEDKTIKNALKKQGQLLIAKYPNHKNIADIKVTIRDL